jgi:hypothetical protein
MSQRMVPQMKSLAGLDSNTLRVCIDAHIDDVTGIEHPKSEFMPRFNQRLMERACLSADEKRRWFDLLNSSQRNRQFFPAGWKPGDGLVTEAFDDEGPSALVSSPSATRCRRRGPRRRDRALSVRPSGQPNHERRSPLRVGAR